MPGLAMVVDLLLVLGFGLALGAAVALAFRAGVAAMVWCLDRAVARHSAATERERVLRDDRRLHGGA